MAVYTTLFLCRPEELTGGFPGWQLPLACPVRREFRDPFTGKTSVIETREPEWPDWDDGEPDRGYHVVAIEGRYEDYLESRLPPFVRARPHWAGKGLTEVELAPLLKACDVEGSWEPAIYGPPSSGALVQQLPPEWLPRLDSLDQEAVAGRWAMVMSSPEYTHSVSGEKLCEGWTKGEALELLRPIVELGRKASFGQRLYLLIEV
jgi:hypothetical protein